MTWATAFLLTQVVESPLYVYALRDVPMSWALRVGVALGASAVTHPVLWAVWPHTVDAVGWWGAFALLELAVVGVEAAYLRAFGLPAAGWVALLVNACSAGVGLAVSYG